MKAKILFLHHNFPAQFRFLALDLAKAGHEVVFLSEQNSTGTLSGYDISQFLGPRLKIVIIYRDSLIVPHVIVWLWNKFGMQDGFPIRS